ncbi:ATP-binding protein [Streptomyces sp. NPDC088725]|uniref:ATP-binding protein n=1 Tax=Streptomyces sp. NPDC088725 TaxID=3365873 RepID=UPI003815E5AC
MAHITDHRAHEKIQLSLGELQDRARHIAQVAAPRRLELVAAPRRPELTASRDRLRGYGCVFTLPCRPESVAAARRRIRLRLRGRRVSENLCDTAELVVSELVTNAVLHTASSKISCEMHVLPGRVRLEVNDQGGESAVRGGHSTGRPLAAHCPDHQAEGGRGLLLVDRMAEAWGVRANQHGAGRTVWAMLRCRQA